jgi:hypothetical protein
MTSKIIIGLLAAILGVSVVWAVRVFQVTSRPVRNVEAHWTEAVAPSPDEMNKIQVRFLGIELHKDWVARFEISNYTAKPLIYVGSRNKPDEYGFCTIAAQRDEKFEQTGVDTQASGLNTRYNCRHSKAVILQTIEPNESSVFAVGKHEVDRLVSLKGEYKNAQIGFEFFVGDEKRREMVWSDDITFPDDSVQ